MRTACTFSALWVWVHSRARRTHTPWLASDEIGRACLYEFPAAVPCASPPPCRPPARPCVYVSMCLWVCVWVCVCVSAYSILAACLCVRRCPQVARMSTAHLKALLDSTGVNNR